MKVRIDEKGICGVCSFVSWDRMEEQLRAATGAKQHEEIREINVTKDGVTVVFTINS